MFREIDRYILREVAPPFGVALLAFLAFIALQVVIYLSDLVLSRGAGVGELFRLLGLKLPSLLTLAIPGGVLLAIFWALGRLAGARELLAFQAVGFSLRRLAFPFVLFGIAMSLVSFALGELVVPHTEELYRREYMTLLLGGRMASPAPQEEVFFRGPKGNLYYVRRYQGGIARGIVVYDLAGRVAPPSGDFPAVITAEEGGFSAGGELELHRGRVLHFDREGRLTRVDGFETLKIEVGADIERLILGGKTPAQMSLRELRERIGAMRQAGVDPRGLLVEYHAKIAVAASSFLFALFGAPVGMILGRRGRVAGAAAGFLLAGAAQALFLWTKTMARQGLIPPEWGAWLPAVPFVALGLLLLWRLDGRRFLWFLLLFLPFASGAAPPPFSLEAETLGFSLEQRSFIASEATIRFDEYTLVATEIRGREEEGMWHVEAEGAEVSGGDISFTAEELAVEFNAQGEVEAFRAQGVTGEARFRGPEKGETLVFVADRAEMYMEGGEIARLVGRGVAFTTCPCLPGAPYAVRASKIVYIPDEWFFAQNLLLSSFGVNVWWLPFYVSRLGEEGPSLFPKIGLRGGELFLKWAFPFTLREELLWGAVGLTFFPERARLEPELSLFWEEGFLSLTPRGLRISGRGEWEGGQWRGDLSLIEKRIRASFSGTASGWSLRGAWERVEKKNTTYEKAPEILLSRSFSLPLGKASLNLSGGRYIQGDIEAIRFGAQLLVHPSAKWGPISVGFPFGGRFDIYAGETHERRYRLNVSPSLSVGGMRMGYESRWGGGMSPLGFDRLPLISRLTLTFSGSEEGISQQFSVSWDLGGNGALQGRWTLHMKEPKLEFSLGFVPYPLILQNFKFSLNLHGEGWGASLQGGGDLRPSLEFQDLIAKGNLSGRAFSLRGGLRFSPYPFRLKRATGELSWAFAEEYRLEIAGEYDFIRGELVQGAVSLVRSFSECLRLGLRVGSREVRVTLEVPAFPGVKLRFSPQDEMLQWGS